MKAGLIILRVASLGRDAQNGRDGARAAQLRRSSDPGWQKQYRSSEKHSKTRVFGLTKNTEKHFYHLGYTDTEADPKGQKH